MKKHKHRFVPVDVSWISLWGPLEKGKRPLPCHVMLACRCGAVKLVPAKLARTPKQTIAYYKEIDGLRG